MPPKKRPIPVSRRPNSMMGRCRSTNGQDDCCRPPLNSSDPTIPRKLVETDRVVLHGAYPLKCSPRQYGLATLPAVPPYAPHSPRNICLETLKTQRGSTFLAPLLPSNPAFPYSKAEGVPSDGKVPAYLSAPQPQAVPPLLQTITAQMDATLHSRPPSAFTATMSLSGRPRSAVRSGPPGTASAAPLDVTGVMQGTVFGTKQLQFEGRKAAAYVVGAAVLNPYVTVSPTVQPGVRGVPSLVTLPDSAWRPAIGPTIDASSESLGDEAEGAPHPHTVQPPDLSSAANFSTTSFGGHVSLTSSHTIPGAAPQLLVSSALFTGLRKGQVTFEDDLTIDGAPVLCVEEIAANNVGSRHQDPLCVRKLRELYNTTEDDVPTLDLVQARLGKAFSFAERMPELQQPPATAVHEILPELLQADARNKELAAVRRHIDWDVTIPTAETMPPPSVVFMDTAGNPMPDLPRVHFLLNTATLYMERDFAADEHYYSTHRNAFSMRGPAHPTATEKSLESAHNVGTRITHSHGTVYRFHGLVGLLRGLAERVGLERVMEYKVQCHSADMLLSPPYVDSSGGDLLIHINPSLFGNIKLTIVGFDCGSIDAETGKVLQSSTTLTVLIKAIAPSGAASQQQQQNSSPEPEGALLNFSNDQRDCHPPHLGASPGSSTVPGGELRPFMFPLSNPHTLRYEECTYTAHKTYLNHKVLEKKLKLSSKAPAVASAAGILVAAKNDAVNDVPAAELSRGTEEQAAGNDHSSPASGEDDEVTARKEKVTAANTTMVADLPAAETGSSRNSAGSPMSGVRPLLCHTPSEHHDSGLTLREEYNCWTASPYSFWLFMNSTQSPLLYLRTFAWTAKVTALYKEEDIDLHSPEARALVKHQARTELGDEVIASLMPGGLPPTKAHVPEGSVSVESIKLLRRLILCLLLEPDRGSRQIFFDLVELCKHLCSRALMCTVASTGGTKEGLQAVTAEMLTAAFPACSQNLVSDKERANLEILSDALEVAITVMVSIGCYVSAVDYAGQRVHVMCLLEAATTVKVYQAQRDLAEVLAFYGDNEASRCVAEDVQILAEQLFAVNSPEEVEGEMLLALTSLSSGAVDRAREVAGKLLQLVASDEEVSADGSHTTPTLPLFVRIAVKLVVGVVFSRLNPTSDDTATGLGCDDVLHIVHEALDTLERQRSELLGSNPNQIAVNQRRCWNYLALAASTLITNGEHQSGIGVLENIIKDLALRLHRFEEQVHLTRLTATLWVSLALWRIYVHPSDAAENQVVLKRAVHNLTKSLGPFHPTSSCANMLYAQTMYMTNSSRALSLSYRSYAALQRCVSPRSNYLSLCHEVCSRINATSGRWKAALEHANAALVIGQINRYSPLGRVQLEELFLGALLQCPQTAVVKLRPALLLSILQERVGIMETTYGTHSALLVLPLLNLADAHFLFCRYDDALAALQRALRVGDPKGILFVAHSILQPACMLEPIDVERRDASVKSVLSSLDSVLRLVETLYATGAVLEAKGCSSDAQDAFGRALALLEAYHLEDSLSAVRVYTALAKLLYTAENYGDALSWARRAARSVHHYFKEWDREQLSAKTLVATMETKLLETEGTYVVINSHNPHDQFVELI